MKNHIGLVFLLLLLFLEQPYIFAKMPQQDEVIDDNLVAVEEVPFSAIIYFREKNQRFCHVNILMAPDQVTLDNLRLLFQRLSNKYASAKILRIRIDTRLERLSSYITGEFHAADPPPSKYENKKKKVKKEEAIEVEQWAVYIRTEDVELIRYNPNYPKANGMETIILRGKE